MGMAEGCWTLAQSGDCLSVQALGRSSLLPQAPTPEWAFQRDMPALSLSITLLPLLSLPPFPLLLLRLYLRLVRSSYHS